MHLDETKQPLASGTGFIYQYREKFYLITNWHNVTGLNPITKEPISKHGGIPDVIVMTLQIRKEPYIQWENFHINLYEDSDADWYVHPIYKELVDVVAMELVIPENFNGMLRPINEIKFDEFKLEVADDVYILGFPYKIKGSGHFPIWKRGSVASEPDLDYEGLPKFFIDTAGKSGMSGAPVVFRRTGIHGAVNGKISNETIIGQIQGFVGVYSGRIVGKSQLDAQLGVVWKKEVIEEIITGGLKDERKFA